MKLSRWPLLILGVVLVAAVAAAVVMHGRGGQESEAGDPDRNAEAHVGSPPGYQAHNQVRVLAAAPAAGWVGESKLATEDTWEPYIATDPGAPYVYAIYNRYGVSCPKSSCPSPQMMVRASADNGVTWGTEHPLCACTKVSGQWDPVIKVTTSHQVLAVWMNYNQIVFAKSGDHGATWSTPVTVSTNSWSDKPWFGASADGTDIYIAWESRSQLNMVSSHTNGNSWSAPAVLNTDSSVYRYPNGFAVLPNGTAIMADSKYPGGSAQSSGTVDIEVWRSTNQGASWTRNVVTQVQTGVDFRTSSTTTLAADAAGTLVMEYSGATTVGGNGHVWTRRSTDGGVTWSAATELANGAVNASFPAIVGGAANDFRLTWMDARGGAWNVWERASTDGGQTWGAEADISDATGGASYKSAAGFTSGYGDYDGIAITNLGKTVSVAGEGVSFSTGPGAIWLNRQN
jgi:BNR repeat protein